MIIKIINSLKQQLQIKQLWLDRRPKPDQRPNDWNWNSNPYLERNDSGLRNFR